MIHPERSVGHKRERLHGAAKTERRMELFERSGGRCEATTGEMICEYGGVGLYFRCNRRINHGTYDPSFNPQGMEWSHNRHAANKCDCLECGIASCHECHERSHNCGGKPITVTKKSLKAAV